MGNYAPYTWHDGDTGGTLVTAARLNSLELGVAAASIAGGGTVLTGTGIDPTGVADSTTAVQAALDASPVGDTVIIPGGAVIRLTAGLTISHRITLTGGGELRWTAGVGGAAAVTVTADGTRIDGVRINNSLGTANQTGARQYGILIAANSVTVTGCTTLQFQQAITISATGEWHDFIIANNTILDVPGSGDGSGSTSSNGEDRGDGIVSWGAAGVITGNRVAAKAGTDARIGIHTEGLPSSETASPAYGHADSMVTIVGNTVTGRFRRSIASETVARVTIVGNTVADATWWGIALIGAAARSVVANNTIKWTRTSADTQGSAWTPARSGIMLYKATPYARVTGNIVYAEPGALMPAGITAQAPDSSNLPTNITIAGNTIGAADGNTDFGIYIPNGGSGVEVIDNRIHGVDTTGIYAAAGVAEFHARGNLITGIAGTTQYGIRVEGASANARTDGNTVLGCTTGIAVRNRTSYVTVIGNVISAATTGVDLFQSAGKATISANTYIGVTNTAVNLPGTGTVASGNN